MAATAIARTKSAPKRKANLPAQLFRKHVGAVQVWNSISVLQRKMFATLLKEAYEELPNLGIVQHEIPIGKLAEGSGFNSNNTQYLKEALVGLVTNPVQWNTLSTDGKEIWAVSATLASARIEDGRVYYSFSHELRRKLYNPEVYALLDLAIISAFRSGYALALYENSNYFWVNGRKETAEFEPAVLRALLGAAENKAYDDFGRFMDKVLKPAMTEVNRISDIRVEPVVTKQGRRVVGIRFKLEGNAQGEGVEIPPAPLVGRDADLFIRIQQEATLRHDIVMTLFETYSDEHLLAVMDYVKDRYMSGKVSKGKIAGYFLTVAKKATPESLQLTQSTLDLPPAQPTRSTEEIAAAAAAEAKKAERKQRLDVVEAAWKAMSAEDRDPLRREFMAYLAQEHRIFYETLRRNADIKPGTGAYRMLLNWLADRTPN